MHIQPLHPNFIMPSKGTELAGAFDLYMPEPGSVSNSEPTKVALGFATAIPPHHVALVLPRSGVGAKHGLELNNTCGVIDADYRGEWFATLRTKAGQAYSWAAGDRLLQFLIIPVVTPVLELVAELPVTARGTGGFGSTGV